MQEISKSRSSVKGIVKKVAIIHGFVYNTARKGIKGGYIVNKLEEEIDGVIGQLNKWG